MTELLTQFLAYFMYRTKFLLIKFIKFEQNNKETKHDFVCNTMKAYTNGPILRQYFSIQTMYFQLLMGLRSFQKSFNLEFEFRKICAE